MSRFWTDDRLATARDVLAAHRSLPDALADMGRRWGVPPPDRSGLHHALRRAGLLPPSSYLMAAPGRCAHPVSVPLIAPEGPTLREQYDLLRAETPRRPAPAVPDGESAVLLVADTHVGEGTADTIARLAALPGRVATALRGRDVAEIVVCVLGDVVTGEGIYHGQWAHTDLWASDQVRQARDALWRLMRDLHEIAPVRAYAVPGNHGRTGHGSGGGASPGANWDVMVYQQLELLCDLTDGGPVWGAHEERRELLSLTVQGQPGAITHGGGKGKLRLGDQWSTPARAVKWIEAAEMSGARWVACGHLHHPHLGKRNGRLFVLAGCLGTVDAEHIARRDPPQTWLLTLTASDLPAMAASLEF